MVLITFSRCQRLLCLNYVQRVSAAELAAAQDDLTAALADLPDGFRLLVDLSQVEFMNPDCLAEVGRAMDHFDQRGVSLIVRVIPDASKDIGLNILTLFHYPHHPRVITCRNMAEALHHLAVWK
jgi:anti-anti-sigma regulatory factor